MRSSCTAISKNLENGGNKSPFMRVEADYCIPFFRKPKRRTAAARSLCFTDPRKNEGAKRPPIRAANDGAAAARGCRFNDPIAFHYPPPKIYNAHQSGECFHKNAKPISEQRQPFFSLMAKRTVKPYRAGA